MLEYVARSYGGYITYSELASRLVDSTGIRTGQLLSNWSGKLLNQVIHLCLERGLPALSSLVVHATYGMVGSGFDEVLRASGRDAPGNDLEREQAAAAERLECYWAYCKDLLRRRHPVQSRCASCMGSSCRPRGSATTAHKDVERHTAASSPQSVSRTHRLT
jgi:hypothetical protein